MKQLPILRIAGLSVLASAPLLHLPSTAHGQVSSITVSGPDAGQFGAEVHVLSNGNYVVVNTLAPNGGLNDAGAVYLYNGSTHALISTTRGSHANDLLGSGGVTVLSNGNFVIYSPFYNGNVGAVTWCSGTTGLNAAISSANSLVGSTGGDFLQTTTSIKALTNGNYIVAASRFDNGAAGDAGAVVWCNGTTGKTGTVSTANALVGAATDRLGSGGVTQLTNGNAVIVSPNWNTDAGAVTWCSGTAGITGSVSVANSLVGSLQACSVGSGGVVPLTNGNYVVRSPLWDNAGLTDVGAATWVNGSTGLNAQVSASNSIIGSSTSDEVSGGGVTALSNRTFVVSSPLWDRGATANAGAATWGSSGTAGAVAIGNSLVGTAANDRVSSQGVTKLTAGNYVVGSPLWNNGATTDAGAATWGSGTTGVSGAVTWGNGTTGIVGNVTAANSTVGNADNARAGSGGVAALVDGDYVIISPNWGPQLEGAVTWRSGVAASTGTILASNSLTGTQPNDNVGSSGVVALPTNAYLVRSPRADVGGLANTGAVTWLDGNAATSATVSSLNSLTGTFAQDSVGDGDITLLASGNYVVSVPAWGTGGQGAVSWGDGSISQSGAVSASNALVGATGFATVGRAGSVRALSNGDYVVRTEGDPLSAAFRGATTYGNGSTGTVGVLSRCNSVVSLNIPGFPNVSYNAVYGSLLVGRPEANDVVIVTPYQEGLAVNSSMDTLTLSGAGTYNFRDSACLLITTLYPSGSSPVSGPVVAKALAQSTAFTYGGKLYVRRWYDITPPAQGTSTATAVAKLYFRQADFDDYNAVAGVNPQLPTGPADAAGIARLRVRQQHGTSPSGQPGTYTGWAGAGPAEIQIDPADGNIIWNSSEQRWEVGIDIEGFSGFFVTAESTPLPLTVLDFWGRAEEAANVLEWGLDREEVGSTFFVERSESAGFHAVGKQAATGAGRYVFTDAAPPSSSALYRLRIAERDGQVWYSKTVSIHRDERTSTRISPNPARTSIELTVENKSLYGTEAKVMGMNGGVMWTFSVAALQTLDVSGWTPGVYCLLFADGSSCRFQKN